MRSVKQSHVRRREKSRILNLFGREVALLTVRLLPQARQAQPPDRNAVASGVFYLPNALLAMPSRDADQARTRELKRMRSKINQLEAEVERLKEQRDVLLDAIDLDVLFEAASALDGTHEAAHELRDLADVQQSALSNALDRAEDGGDE